MARYQVEYRTYSKEYENNPPPWVAVPWSSITPSIGTARSMFRSQIETLLARTRSLGLSFSAIIEVRLVSSEGGIVDYHKTVVEKVSRS